MGNVLDKNTILSLNQDPKSIDMHKMALSKMRNAKVDPSAKHDFIFDRMRQKSINNIDDLYSKLNDLEKNGVLDIWINKFGKQKYMQGKQPLKESVELKVQELIETALEEIGAPLGGSTLGGSGPIATMAGPGKNKTYPGGIINKNPDATLTGEKTHQDTNIGGI